MDLYQSGTIKKIDAFAQKYLGLSETLLIKRAAEKTLELIQNQFPKTQKIFIFTGPGNNGADGLVLAKLAFLIGYQVQLISLSTQLKKNHQELKKIGIKILKLNDYDSNQAILNELNDSDLIIDAIFGIGLSRSISGDFKIAIKLINQAKTKVLALDIPSGLSADTGYSLGAAVKADKTISFITHKFGMVSSDGVDYSGEIHFSNLGIDTAKLIKRLNKEQGALPCVISPKFKTVKKLLPIRKINSHKNTFGTSLLIGGNKNMAGALVLSALASQKMGVGLVKLITRKKNTQIIPIIHPEIMSYQKNNFKNILSKSSTKLTIAIGPGLGKNKWAKDVFAIFLKSQQLADKQINIKPSPAVIDADALNLLAELNRSNQFTKTEYSKNWVLTPHPKEAARLLDTNIKTINSDRLSAIKQLHNLYGSVIVLKGKGSLIFDGLQVYHCRYGSSAMAKGGMGDVLAGIIVSLLAQNIKPNKAALIGTIFHSYFADVAAKKEGIHSLTPTDLINQINF